MQNEMQMAAGGKFLVLRFTERVKGKKLKGPEGKEIRWERRGSNKERWMRRDEMKHMGRKEAGIL